MLVEPYRTTILIKRLDTPPTTEDWIKPHPIIPYELRIS